MVSARVTSRIRVLQQQGTAAATAVADEGFDDLFGADFEELAEEEEEEGETGAKAERERHAKVNPASDHTPGHPGLKQSPRRKPCGYLCTYGISVYDHAWTLGGRMWETWTGSWFRGRSVGIAVRAARLAALGGVSWGFGRVYVEALFGSEAGMK